MNKDYAMDSVDERDYLYSDVFEEEIKLGTELPSKKLLDNVDYQNQGLEEITKYMCVFYSTAHGVNEGNYQEGSDLRVDGKAFGLVGYDKGRLDLKVGAYVSDGPLTAREEGYIKGWTKIKTLEDFKHSINKNRPLVLGSNKLKWSTGYKKPFVVSGNKGSGHAILGIGYDDNYMGGCIIIKNSYGNKKYDNGKMYIKYSDFNLLFDGKYSLIDSPDPILEYKKKVMEKINIPMAKVGYELGLWNGKNATESITREEAVTIAMRAIEKTLSLEIDIDKMRKIKGKYNAK